MFDVDFGLLVFPPFWVIGAWILWSPPRAFNNHSGIETTWMADKTELECQSIIGEMRRAEVRWALRCIWALLILILLGICSGIMTWVVLHFWTLRQLHASKLFQDKPTTPLAVFMKKKTGFNTTNVFNVAKQYAIRMGSQRVPRNAQLHTFSIEDGLAGRPVSIAWMSTRYLIRDLSISRLTSWLDHKTIHEGLSSFDQIIQMAIIAALKIIMVMTYQNTLHQTLLS